MPEHGRNAVARLFAQGAPPCDAIVTANDWMALGSLQALEERSLRVPEDVALVGFDDIEESGFSALFLCKTLSNRACFHTIIV